MRYFWAAALAGISAAGTASAGQEPVPIPTEFPRVMPVAPPILAPAPPPPSPYARPVRPKGNPAYWVTSVDYPAEALREEVSGVARFRLIVGTDGRVTQCEIMATSGSAALDATTCNLVTRRARFDPARDEAGNPTVGTYWNAVRWVIPVYMPPPPGSFTETFDVDNFGLRKNCRVISAKGDFYEKGPGDCGGDRPDYFRGQVAGKPALRVIRSLTITIANAPDQTGERPATVRALRPAGAWPVSGTRVTEAIVETDGTISDCRVTSVTGPLAEVLKVNTNDCPRRFERGYAAANGQIVRALVRMTDTTTVEQLSQPTAKPGKAAGD
ncbi:energy transducer TonB [Novosphingobium sp. TH158]|uniref:energy transducer TonB n=1 Tax=Novosphingobium sp. TH158 TaxID=2067455 RepID=UPI000C7A24B8|nr:energy transducer TonB [Novosphingobium sp. TH158]PLK26267.1 hypothetical protein C0V78_04735 [Novosphingobium sp. TH158]